MGNGNLPEKERIGIRVSSYRKRWYNGGCAAVICNTVDQAQKVYEALKHYFPVEMLGDGYPELDLLHARYLYGDRKKREERTYSVLGNQA